MQVYIHESDGSVFVLGSEEGLGVPMLKTPEGEWVSEMVTVGELMESYLQVPDEAAEHALFEEAMAAYKQIASEESVDPEGVSGLKGLSS